MKPIRLIEVCTTAYFSKEESFYLVTDLTDDEIESVIKPIVIKERIVMKERNDSIFNYDNEMLVDSLREAYKDAFIQHYEVCSIDFIRI